MAPPSSSLALRHLCRVQQRQRHGRPLHSFFSSLKHANNDNNTKSQAACGRGRPHPRNSFQGSYDMERLTSAFPALGPHVKLGPTGRPTIPFADPAAVRALNTALLVADYGVTPDYYDLLPRDSLVPPVPGRADYVHHIADVLQEAPPSHGSERVPTGPSVTGMDIGTGASCIYPTIATSVYEWKMIASEINPASVASAREIVKANCHDSLIDVRHQDNRSNIFDGILKETERIDFCMCNPPFYASPEAFRKENARKLKGLAKSRANRRGKVSSDDNNAAKKFFSHVEEAKEEVGRADASSNNFGGIDSELWCPGGEVAFVQQIISESKSKRYWDKCLWFSTLVSRKENLEKLEQSLLYTSRKRNKGVGRKKKERQVQSVKRIAMGAGIKSSTILMWSFLDEGERRDWARLRR